MDKQHFFLIFLPNLGYRVSNELPTQDINKVYSMKIRKFLGLLLMVALLFSAVNCSAFQIRQTLPGGEVRTYITDSIFVGTGTFLDCVISPVHYLMGLFYIQSYIDVKGGKISYPRLGASGCLVFGYRKGGTLLSFLTLGLFDYIFFPDNSTPQVYFVDPDGKERGLIGGDFEITRIAPKINFSTGL